MNYFTKEKHYNTLDNYYKKTYQSKVFKIPLNGNFTCPNIDGTVGFGGCSFCHSGSGDFAGSAADSLELQFEKGLKMMQKKWPEGLLIPYFQVNTNTHAPLSKIKDLFEKAITLHEKIIGLSIGTRPDCLPVDILDYLADLNQRMPLTVELGLQTIHQQTADLVNRCHDLKTFDDAVFDIQEYFHYVAAFGVAHRAYAACVFYLAHVSGVAEVIHYFFAVHFILPLFLCFIW